MTQIMSHSFYAGDSFEHMIWFMGFDWLKEVVQLTQVSQVMDFTL